MFGEDTRHLPRFTCQRPLGTEPVPHSRRPGGRQLRHRTTRMPGLSTSFRPTFSSLPGGDERTRTANLSLAKAALSQLSYIPCGRAPSPLAMLVGLSGLEPLTSRLSGVRSSQLSYRPACGRRQHSRPGPRAASEDIGQMLR